MTQTPIEEVDTGKLKQAAFSIDQLRMAKEWATINDGGANIVIGVTLIGSIGPHDGRDAITKKLNHLLNKISDRLISEAIEELEADAGNALQYAIDDLSVEHKK